MKRTLRCVRIKCKYLGIFTEVNFGTNYNGT